MARSTLSYSRQPPRAVVHYLIVLLHHLVPPLLLLHIHIQLQTTFLKILLSVSLWKWKPICCKVGLCDRECMRYHTWWAHGGLLNTHYLTQHSGFEFARARTV